MYMTQNFNFETNIEKRMPDTGKVFMVDRMTSDYALAHPFDVDGFVHDVAVKHGADEERVRLFFNYGLGKMGEKFSTHCPCKHKDKVKVDKKTGIGELIFGEYPPYVNGSEPALVESWLKGVDYHTCGFRIGDTLPAKVPPHTITRLGDGEWICLFPKDMHLLEESSEIVAVEQEAESAEPDNLDIGLDNEVDSFGRASADAHLTETLSEQNDALAESEHSQEPKELDLFAQMQAEMDAMRMQNEALRMRNEELSNMTQTRSGENSARIVFDTENCSCVSQEQPSIPRQRPRRVRRQKHDVMQLYSTPAITVDHTMDDDHSERNKKIFAAVATAVVFVVLVNTVGLFGIAALGLLAGGLIK